MDTVVQPDLLVVCDERKLDSRGVRGAPDFIAEVLSPGTERYDQRIKFNLYRQAGVREYWIVDPKNRMVQAYSLKDGQYVARMFSEEDRAEVSIFEGLSIDLAAVFPAEEAEAAAEE